MPSKITQFAVAIEAQLNQYVDTWAKDLFAVWLDASRVGDVEVATQAVNDGAEVIRNRMAMGADSFTWQNFQLGKVEAIDERDGRFKWILDGGADHCDTCLAYAGGGPYTLAELPGIPGDAPTICNGGCRCDLVEVTA